MYRSLPWRYSSTMQVTHARDSSCEVVCESKTTFPEGLAQWAELHPPVENYAANKGMQTIRVLIAKT